MQVSLAWALPDKPTYPDEELMEQYEKGRLPSPFRSDENATDLIGIGEIQVSTAPSNIRRNQTNFAYHIYPPQSPTFDPTRRYNAFANYLQTYLRSGPESKMNQIKSTTVSTETT